MIAHGVQKILRLIIVYLMDNFVGIGLKIHLRIRILVRKNY